MKDSYLNKKEAPVNKFSNVMKSKFGKLVKQNEDLDFEKGFDTGRWTQTANFNCKMGCSGKSDCHRSIGQTATARSIISKLSINQRQSD